MAAVSWSGRTGLPLLGLGVAVRGGTDEGSVLCLWIAAVPRGGSQ